MKNFVRKPEIVQAITFEEFVEYGKSCCGDNVGEDGMPWSFEWMSRSVTHETNEKYLVSMYHPEDLSSQGSAVQAMFTPDVVMVYYPTEDGCGYLDLIDAEEFEENYEEPNDRKNLTFNPFWIEVMNRFVYSSPLAGNKIQITMGGIYTKFLLEFKPELKTPAGEIQRKIPTGRYTIPYGGCILEFTVIDEEIFKISTPVRDEKSKKSFFKILDKMNLMDEKNSTENLSVCPDFVAANYSQKMNGTQVTMGVPGNVCFDLENGKTVPYLILIDRNEYNKINESWE